ncbi:MAG: pilus assembly protein PilM [Candidatus Omnitrophica bacterium]|nr:pilus assembly protein PilM [Candidatus Omnitrophota bacterium]
MKIFGKSIGLYVGKEAVAMAVVKAQFVKSQLTRVKTIDLSPEVIEKGTAPADTAAIFDNFFKKEKINAPSITLSITSDKLMVRYFQIPNIPKDERPSAISFEAKRYVPFDPKEVYSTFKIVGEKKGDNKLDVLFCAAQKEFIDSYLSAYKEKKLRITSIEPSVFSLVRLLLSLKAISAENVVVIVEIAKKEAQIHIVKGEIVYISRVVPLEEALPPQESVQPQETAATDTQGEVLPGQFDALADELNLSIRYLKKEYPSVNVEKMLITGEEHLVEIKEALAKVFEIPIEILDITKISKDIRDSSHIFAFGAASRQMGKWKTAAEINMLPGAGKQSALPFKVKKGEEYRIVAAIGLPIALLIVGMVHAKTAGELKTLKRQMPTQDQIISEGLADIMNMPLESLTAEKKKLEAQKAAYQSALEILKISFASKLKSFADNTPHGIWLTSFSFSIDKGGSLTMNIRGAAYSEDQDELSLISTFTNDLKKDPNFIAGFKSMELGTIDKETISDTTITRFNVTFK